MSRLKKCFKCALHSVPQIRNLSATPKKASFSTLAFGKYLLLTNMATSGVLMCLGDIALQEFEWRKGKIENRYDYGRLTRMLLIGLGLGPILHYYYLFLWKMSPTRELSSVAIKIGFDQVLISPLFIALFFYGLGMLEMKPVKKINEEVVDKFLDVYVMDWCVWVPAQFINFYLVRVKYQVLYVNAVTMVYNGFLSYIKHDL